MSIVHAQMRTYVERCSTKHWRYRVSFCGLRELEGDGLHSIVETDTPTCQRCIKAMAARKRRYIENPNSIGSDAGWTPHAPPPEDEDVHPAVRAARMRGALR